MISVGRPWRASDILTPGPLESVHVTTERDPLCAAVAQRNVFEYHIRSQRRLRARAALEPFVGYIPVL